MSAAVLFPADPLSPRRVDPHFAAQAAAARELDGRVALIDHDALLAGDLAGAVRRVSDLPAGVDPARLIGPLLAAGPDGPRGGHR